MLAAPEVPVTTKCFDLRVPRLCLLAPNTESENPGRWLQILTDPSPYFFSFRPLEVGGCTELGTVVHLVFPLNQPQFVVFFLSVWEGVWKKQRQLFGFPNNIQHQPQREFCQLQASARWKEEQATSKEFKA